MNKRKNRGGSVRAQRQRSVVAEGVYSNASFMYATTAQVGNRARITTSSGQVWEGIFRTFSANFDVVLELATKVANPDSSDSQLLTDTLVDKLIFKPNDILSMTFRDIDLDYPTRDSFQTDSAISARLNGSKLEEKELEPWDAGQLNGNDNLSLDLETANGWDVNDMFRKNEQDYGVQSTFDQSLKGYTVPLQTSDSPDYREAQAKADQIANEIESQPSHKVRAELENGDEEAAFAAVVRPNQQESNGKYIPPAKRKGQNNGKLVRSTPPPSSGGSSQNSPSPKETRAPVSYPAYGPPTPQQQHVQMHQNSVHIPVQNQHGSPQPPPQQQQIQHVPTQPHMHNAVPPGVPPQMQNMPPQPHQQNMPLPPHATAPQQQPPRPSSHTPPHQYQQGPPPRQGAPHSGPPHGAKPQMNGEAKSGPQQRQQRHQQYQQDRQVPQGGMAPSQQQGVYQDVKQQESLQLHQVQPQPQQQPPHAQPRQGPPPPRHDLPQANPQNQETLKDLHAFSQEFKLAPMQPQNSPMQSQASPNIAQPGPNMPQHLQQVPGQPPNLGPQPHLPGPESPQMGPPQVPQHMGMPQGPPNVVSNTINSPIDNQGGPPQGGPPAKQPSPAQSPQSTESEKLQNTVAKSKLNPAAKPFQPRSPSTPSASRPHTPQTPSHSPYIPATLSGVPVSGAPPMPATITMMPIGPYMNMSPAAAAAQYQPPPPQPNRLRKIQMGGIRTDGIASHMQHAAAVTGQPLLAPAPLPTHLFYGPAAAAAAAASAHSMGQSAATAAAYQPTAATMHAMVRMYSEAAAAAAQAQQAPPQVGVIQYLPPQPSGTPSPAQAPYNPPAVQQPQGPPQGYQVGLAAPPPQGPPQTPMYYIPTQPHMLPNVSYLQQAPPPPPPHQHVQVLVQHQHPGTQGGNPHGPNP